MDISVSVRPACCSSSRSVSMSLPRYHHVEMPMPAPNVPSTVFSCQKQPASPTTTFVNIADPTALFTSASVTPLQSPLRKPLPDGAGDAGLAGSSGEPQPTNAERAITPTTVAAKRRNDDIRTGLITASHVRRQGGREQLFGVLAWVAVGLAAELYPPTQHSRPGRG